MSITGFFVQVSVTGALLYVHVSVTGVQKEYYKPISVYKKCSGVCYRWSSSPLHLCGCLQAAPWWDTLFVCRAGQATTLPRQRGHVFRPNKFWHYVFNWRCYSFRNRRLQTFAFFSLKLYFVSAFSLSQSWAIVACPALFFCPTWQSTPLENTKMKIKNY